MLVRATTDTRPHKNHLNTPRGKNRVSSLMHVARCADHYAAACQEEKAASCRGSAFDSFETENTVTDATERVAFSTRDWFPIASLSR